MVRLPDFILANSEAILAEWETFARGIWPEPASTDSAELRNRAEFILRAAVADMDKRLTKLSGQFRREGKQWRDLAAREI